MLYHNVRVLTHAGSAIDAAVVTAAAALVWALDSGPGYWDLAATRPALWTLCLSFWLAFVLISGRMQLYHPWRTEGLWRELAALAECTAYAMGLASVLTAVLAAPLPGTLLAAMLVSGLVGVLLARVATRLLIRRLRSRGDDYRVWLVVGRNLRSAELMGDILANPQYGIRIAAVVDMADADQVRTPDSAALAKLPSHVLNDAEGLRALLQGQVIDEVLITLPVRSRYDDIQTMLRICSQAGISVKLLPEAFELPASGRHLAHIGRIPVLTHYSGTGQYGQLLAKRVIDMLGAAGGLTLLAPLIGLIAAVVALDSPGPVLFRQTRVGLHGRHFTIRKFRTMFTDAEVRRAELAQHNERDGSAFKIRNDPRITHSGRWLRKFHLDELPQLWNVLVGDMSLVGPRPLPVAEATGNEWWQRRRLSVPPGLTCLWQLQDDPLIPFQQWMRMDIDYIDRWSLWLDLKIICLTFGTLARGRGW